MWDTATRKNIYLGLAMVGALLFLLATILDIYVDSFFGLYAIQTGVIAMAFLHLAQNVEQPEQDNSRFSQLSESPILQSVTKPIFKAKRGYVYLLRAENGLHKIGQTNNLTRRMRYYGGLPIEITLIHSFYCQDCLKNEKRLHRRYAAQRVRGEWFALTAEHVNEIKAIKEM